MVSKLALIWVQVSLLTLTTCMTSVTASLGLYLAFEVPFGCSSMIPLPGFYDLEIKKAMAYDSGLQK